MLEVEICVDSIESATNAAAGGCTRLELCSSLAEGGLTPTPAMVRCIKNIVDIPVFCMVRCRGGDMVFSRAEVDLMKDEAADLKEAGADGLVFGALTSEGTIDKDACSQILSIAKGLPCTFHRAFDLLSDPNDQLQEVIDLGFCRVLTSGCAPNAPDGVLKLEELVRASQDRIGIMAGAGVKSSNVAEIISKTGVQMVHASAKMCIKQGSSRVQMGNVDDTVRWITDASEVEALVSAAKSAVPKPRA